METVLEILMIVAFDIGVVALIVRFMKHGCRAGRAERLLILGTGMGYIGGLVAAGIRNLPALILLYGMSVMLCYGAMVLSFPSREKDLV